MIVSRASLWFLVATSVAAPVRDQNSAVVLAARGSDSAFPFATFRTQTGDDFTQFTGDPSGSNSWFDASLWPEHPDYPSTGDAVWMDTTDAYGNVDSNDVVGLYSLTVAGSAYNVELEISQSRKVSVDTNVIVGQDMGSSGKITMNTDAQLDISGDLTVGGDGTGSLETNGGQVAVAGALDIGVAGVINMSGGKLVLQGDQLDSIHNYLHDSGKMTPNDGMDTYAIYDVTEAKTIIRGPPGGGDGGPRGVVRSGSCSPSGEVILTYEEGDTLDLAISSTLCTLVEVDTSALENGARDIRLKPVARSYSGGSWEAYAGNFASVQFDCSGGSCQASPPAPPEGRVFILKSYSPPSYSGNDLSARFLEKTTFGPKRDEIASFGSPESWVESQVEMATITSHRAFFRERLTHWHSESSYHSLLHKNPCEEGARYRRYAFLPTDNDRFMKIESSAVDPSMVILSVGGITRTVVQGPVQCGGSSQPDLDLSDGEYEIGTPADLEGVHTEVRIKPCSTCNYCDLWINGEYGNPPSPI